MTLDSGQVLLLITGALSAMATALGVLWKALSSANNGHLLELRREIVDVRTECDELRAERDSYRHELFEMAGLTGRASRALARTTDEVLKHANTDDLDARLRRLEEMRNDRTRASETDA